MGFYTISQASELMQSQRAEYSGHLHKAKHSDTDSDSSPYLSDPTVMSRHLSIRKDAVPACP